MLTRLLFKDKYDFRFKQHEFTVSGTLAVSMWYFIDNGSPADGSIQPSSLLMLGCFSTSIAL